VKAADTKRKTAASSMAVNLLTLTESPPYVEFHMLTGTEEIIAMIFEKTMNKL
jgi:hypothetical protein